MSTVDLLPSGLRLRVCEGATHSEYLSLERDVISIGRSTPDTVSSPAYLTFPEPTVSRLHAVLTWEKSVKAYLVHHRSQTNPTLLNGKVVGGPLQIKPGDTLTLGRLIMVVEVEEVQPVAPPPFVPHFSLNARAQNAPETLSVPVSAGLVSVVFSASYEATAIADPGPDRQIQEIRLPAPEGTTLRFELRQEDGPHQVQLNSAEHAAQVVSPGLGTELRFPLQNGCSLPFLGSDFVAHQGYKIWLGHPQNGPDNSSTLSEKPSLAPPTTYDSDHELSLRFLNGPWKDAVIVVPPNGPAKVNLGPGTNDFRHPFPFTQTPKCLLTILDGVARLRAVEVADDQFLEVDGDLVFASESVLLIGGSRILLGEAEFLWTDPRMEAIYSRFQLSGEGTAYPLRKSSVRLGTAAHCEVMLPNRELAPVIGRISFETGEPVYHHLDITSPVRIDGVETSTGLSASLQAGSEIELAPGIVLRFEPISDH